MKNPTSTNTVQLVSNDKNKQVLTIPLSDLENSLEIGINGKYSHYRVFIVEIQGTKHTVGMYRFGKTSQYGKGVNTNGSTMDIPSKCISYFENYATYNKKEV